MTVFTDGIQFQLVQTCKSWLLCISACVSFHKHELMGMDAGANNTSTL